jgi:hypothetical protein
MERRKLQEGKNHFRRYDDIVKLFETNRMEAVDLIEQYGYKEFFNWIGQATKLGEFTYQEAFTILYVYTNFKL